MDTRARLLAIEVLLADPESLGNDALEADLYFLRDQVWKGTDPAGEQHSPSRPSDCDPRSSTSMSTPPAPQ